MIVAPGRGLRRRRSVVTVEIAGARTKRIPTRTTLGPPGSSSRRSSSRRRRTGAPSDRNGRILVGPDLTVPGHPEIFAIGDAAVQPWNQTRPVPGVAQWRDPSGRHRRRRSGAAVRRAQAALRYSNEGDLAVIGRLAGVDRHAVARPVRPADGFFASALWLSIHIVYLIGFANQLS